MSSCQLDEKLSLLTVEEEVELGRRIARTWGRPYFDAKTNIFSYALEDSLIPGTEYMAELRGVKIKKPGEAPERLVWSFTTSEQDMCITPGFKRAHDVLDIYIRPYNETETGIRPPIEVLLGKGLGLKRVPQWVEKQSSNYIKGYYFMLWDSEAVNTLAERNIGLIKNIAGRYNKLWGLGVFEFNDLVGVGFIGAVKAAQRWDYKRGTKFATHAVPWIQEEIRRYLKEEIRLIRVPARVWNKQKEIEENRGRLTYTLGRKPTNEELARHLGYAVGDIITLTDVFQEPASKESPIGENGKVIEDIIADQNEGSFEYVERLITREALLVLISTLSDKEKDVLMRRSGFEDGTGQTLEEVGHVYGITKQAVKVIEKKAIEKLRRKVRAIGRIY